MKKNIVVILAVFTLTLTGIGNVLAVSDQSQALGNHHQELTLAATPGEMLYIPIPKQNFPVRVDVVIPNHGTASWNSGRTLTSFIVADIQRQGPMIEIPYGAVSCGSDLSLFGASELYTLGNSQCDIVEGEFVFGIAQVVPGLSNRIVIGVTNYTPNSGSIPVYISMWY